MNSYWVVAKTKSNREVWAAENVQRQGFHFYLPRFSKTIKQNGLMMEVVRPVFPSYLFVRIDGPWRSLLGTFGLTGVLLSGNGPAIMPNEGIEELMARQDISGLVVFDKVGNVPRFKRGDAIAVTGGAMAGMKGIHQGSTDKEREWILLDYMGRKIKTLIASKHLEAA